MSSLNHTNAPAQRDTRIDQLNNNCSALLGKVFERWFKLSDSWLKQAAEQQSDPRAQQHYYGALQSLHRHRHRLQGEWRQHLQQEFTQFWQQPLTADGLAQWQDHPWHATLARMIGTTETRSPARLNQILLGLNRYQQRQQALAQLPCSPTRLVIGFAQILSSVVLADDAQIPLLGKWESALQAELGQTLGELQQFLDNEQHLSRAEQTAATTGSSPLRLSNLQALLSLRGERAAPLGSAHAGQQSTQTLSREAMLAYIDRFQLIQLDAHAGDPVLSTTLSIQDFRFWLQQELTTREADQGAQQLSRVDDDLCSLTELMIAGLECPQLPQPVRSLLLRLQILLLKAMLVDQSLLTDAQHSVRQYLDSVGRFALGWKPTTGLNSDLLLATLQQSVTRLLRAYQRDSDAFSNETIWLNQSLTGDQQRRERMAQRTFNTEIGRLRLTRGQHFIDAAMAKRKADRELPAIGEILLEGPWRQALLQILLNQGCHSTEWHAALVTTDHLIGSLQEPRLTETLSAGERQDWINRLPGMVRRLVHELDASQCAAQRIGKITQALWQYHAERFQLSAADLRNVPHHDQPHPIDTDWLQQTLSESQQCFTVLAIDAWSDLPSGEWALLERGRNQYAAQVAGYIPETASYLFVDYDGKKCAHLSRTQIASLKKQHRFEMLGSEPLSEHIVQHLKASLANRLTPAGLDKPVHSKASSTSSSSTTAGASGVSSWNPSISPRLRSDANAPI